MRRAALEVRAKLIGMLMQPECHAANHILQCLALAGGGDVLAAFVELEKHPRAWAKKLNAPPSVYAHAGGWTFDKNGNLVVLNFGTCYPVFPVTETRKADPAVSVAQPREDICTGCGTRLMDVLRIDADDGRLSFLGTSGIITATVCPNCAPVCERTDVRYTLDGGATMEVVEPWPDQWKMPEGEYAAMTGKKYALAPNPEPVFYPRGLGESTVTIGGFADWIQGFQYKTCPDCRKTMHYLASVPWAALSDYSEGDLYLEICTDCRVISAFHQQT